MKRQANVRPLWVLFMMVMAAVSTEVRPTLSPEAIAELEKSRLISLGNLFNWDDPAGAVEHSRTFDNGFGGSTEENLMNGMKDIANVIEEGREYFRHGNRVDVRKENVPYHSGLAAQYGTLSSDTIISMDNNLKATIAGTNRLMKKLQRKVDNIGSEIPFDDYLAVMHQNVMLKQKENSDILKSDMLSFEGTNWFKFDGSPDKKKVMQVMTWFSNLINDTDVLKDTRIQIEDLANIVAATGAAVSDFATFFYARDYVERSIVDVGILRYPDPLNPFFKLYRIKIFAYRRSFRILATQKDESGIKGDYQAVQFVPRPKILKRMRAEIMEKAVAEAEAMFDF